MWSNKFSTKLTFPKGEALLTMFSLLAFLTLSFFTLIVLMLVFFTPDVMAQGSQDSAATVQTQQEEEANPFADDDGATEDDPFAQGDDSEGGAGFGGDDSNSAALKIEGFVEMERGVRTGPRSVHQGDFILDTTRVRLMTTLNNDNGGAFFKLDFINDGITGEEKVEVREARVQYTPVSWMDLNLGKQVSTWGVGDMVFINDLFPKNWINLLTGRDMESMKDSANALRVATYMGPVSWDLVYHPQFAPDTTPNGCRFAVYDPNQGQLAAFPQNCQPNTQAGAEKSVEEGEIATRLQTMLGGMEMALYGYNGFFKSPRGLTWLDANGDPITGAPDPGAGDYLSPIYPRLSVVGLSLEGQLGPGIVSFEAGQYNSLDDPDGDAFLIENSMRKMLLGYRMDFSSNLSAGMQIYSEQMLDYDGYEASVLANNPAGYDYRKEEQRDTYTLRVTMKMQSDTLWVNLFAFNRPQDKDRYTKLDITKRLDNNFEFVTGANIFDGEDHYLDREFAMLRDDDNAYLRLKYNF